MTEDIELTTSLPSDCGSEDRARFFDLVVRGGEVGGAVLAENIADARILVMLRQGGMIRGTAALKRPRESYRRNVASKARIEMAKSDVPYELGYIFIEPDLQGRGLSHLLVAEALQHGDGAAIFATVRADNDPMRATLAKAGFAAAGQTYLGRKRQAIGLLLRPAQ